ncbi:MAG: DUF6265 family protein, partial [Planctomycetota bacterium]
MQLRTCRFAVLTLVAVFIPFALPAQETPAPGLDGEWTYLEDRTEGRSLERMGPPMSARFSLRVEGGAVVLVRGHGSGHRDVRVALDGSINEVAGERSVARYRGSLQDGAFIYEVDFVREPGTEPDGLIRREFRLTDDGLVVRASRTRTEWDSVALYRHADDIPMPDAAPAVIGDLGWLAGAWVGSRSSGGSVEERWTPPLGGAMLGVSRTVSPRGKMSAFEYLRIVERDGGLIYIAQPGGGAPTEFVLTEWSTTRAVFANPRHDYPKRITYERTAEGG